MEKRKKVQRSANCSYHNSYQQDTHILHSDNWSGLGENCFSNFAFDKQLFHKKKTKVRVRERKTKLQRTGEMDLHHNSWFNCPGLLKSTRLEKTIMATKSRLSATPSSQEIMFIQKHSLTIHSKCSHTPYFTKHSQKTGLKDDRRRLEIKSIIL